MADTFTARSSTRTNVREAIQKVSFPPAGDSYSTVDACRLHLGIKRVLTETHNPGGGSDGMARLLVSSKDAKHPSKLSAIKSTDSATANTILAQSRAEADAKAKQAKKDPSSVTPLINTRPDANEAADRANLTTQAVIGAKEGVAEALVAMLGRRITDAVLRTDDGSDVMSIDAWEECELVAALQQNAEQPKFVDVRTNLVAALTFRFDLRLYFQANVSTLRAKLSKLASAGITVGDDIIANIVLAEAEAAAREP